MGVVEAPGPVPDVDRVGVRLMPLRLLIACILFGALLGDFHIDSRTPSLFILFPADAVAVIHWARGLQDVAFAYVDIPTV